MTQTAPSLEPPAATEHVLEDLQDSVSISHKEAGGGAKSSEINHSNSSLKIPVRDAKSLQLSKAPWTNGLSIYLI